MLIVASLLFYSAGSLMHLPLLLAVAAVNYFAGLLFQRHIKQKKPILILALVLNLGTLVIFMTIPFRCASRHKKTRNILPLTQQVKIC